MLAAFLAQRILPSIQSILSLTVSRIGHLQAVFKDEIEAVRGCLRPKRRLKLVAFGTI
jgi:hypothetical protein